MWICVGGVADIDDGEALRVSLVDRAPLAVFNVAGDFFCIDDTCTHDEASLADGYIEGDVVECAFHFAKFAIRTGAVLSPPATLPVRTYEVKIIDGKIHVDLPDESG